MNKEKQVNKKSISLETADVIKYHKSLSVTLHLFYRKSHVLELIVCSGGGERQSGSSPSGTFLPETDMCPTQERKDHGFTQLHVAARVLRLPSLIQCLAQRHFIVARRPSSWRSDRSSIWFTFPYSEGAAEVMECDSSSRRLPPPALNTV
ncbi:uncharacterized protein V6R79_022388 [Siganus canaliculatus]